MENTLGRVQQAPTHGRISQNFHNEDNIEFQENHELSVRTKTYETHEGGKASKIVVGGSSKRVQPIAP